MTLIKNPLEPLERAKGILDENILASSPVLDTLKSLSRAIVAYHEGVIPWRERFYILRHGHHSPTFDPHAEARKPQPDWKY
jgi:hypothetical protein